MILRPLSDVPGERAFIARSWVESYALSDTAKLCSYAGCCPWLQGARWEASVSYWSTWNALVNELIDRGTVTVAEERGVVAGFLVSEPWGDATAVHYVYTRLSWRSQGIARKLVDTLPVGPVIFTHRSRSVHVVPQHWRFSLAPLFGVMEGRRAA